MRALLICALLALRLTAVAGAAPHRPRVYPNTSLTIFSIAEGPDGLLWLAAADGLYRFDGFHYHKIASFPFASARFVAFTRDRSLWCGGLEGLARLRNNRFEILLTDEVSALAAYPDQLFVGLTHHLLRISLDGSIHNIEPAARRDLTIDASGRLWYVCTFTKLACWSDPKEPGVLHTTDLPAGMNFKKWPPIRRDAFGPPTTSRRF